MKEIVLNIEHPQLPPMMKYRRLCLESDLAELAKYYGQSYALPLCEYAEFSYDRARSDEFSERFIVTKNILDMFGMYGVAFEKKRVTNKAKYRKYLTDKIKSGAPVIVHLDCYYAPWDPAYGRDHNNHTAIVAGIRNDAYLLSDPYFGTCEWIEKTEFHKGSDFYYEIDFGVKNLWGAKTHRKVLEDKITQLQESGYYDRLEELSEDLRVIQPDLSEIDAIANLFGDIEWNKQKFMMFLFEWETAEGHRRYTEEYSKIWSRWQVLKVMTLKAKYRTFPVRRSCAPRNSPTEASSLTVTI